ncbi:hypothetical protein HPG69_018306, partial [Diceros bicornis minor]
CGECKDIIESVLKKELHFNEENLAEKSTLAQTLSHFPCHEIPAHMVMRNRQRQLHAVQGNISVLIQDQEQQLTWLWQRLQEGRDISILLSQHLKDLLIHNDVDNCQGQGFREQLAEGHRLAESIVRKLSPGKVATGPDCPELLQGPRLTRDSTAPLAQHAMMLIYQIRDTLLDASEIHARADL